MIKVIKSSSEVRLGISDFLEVNYLNCNVPIRIYGTGDRRFYSNTIKCFMNDMVLFRGSDDIYTTKIRVSTGGYNFRLSDRSDGRNMSVDELFIPLFLYAPRKTFDLYKNKREIGMAILKEKGIANIFPEGDDLFSEDNINRFLTDRTSHYNMYDKMYDTFWMEFCSIYRDIAGKWRIKI